MKTKKTFLFDEEKEAEDIIINGFDKSGIDYAKMYLVAKYFREKLGYGAIRLEKELINFCKQQDKNFNPVVEADSIQKWIKSALAYGLKKIESISISQKEIDFLRKIDIPKERRLMFVTLVLAKGLKKRNTKKKRKKYKISDNYYIHYNNFNDIIKLAKISNMRDTDLANIFYKYKEHFKFYSPEKELLRLEFADPHPETKIEITNLENLVEEYNNLFGKNTANCLRCGKSFVRTNGNQKNCKECGKIIENERQKILMRRRRSEKIGNSKKLK
jgi:hypothetical protein